MQGNSWKVAAASVAGVSHEKTGLPCQDAHAWRLLANDCLVAAVADGAGSASLSDVGAQLAVQVSLQTLERLAPKQAGIATCDEVTEALRETLLTVQAALEQEAAARQEAVRELATTLILVLASPTQIAALQVGDGAVVAWSVQGELQAVTTPPDAEYANATTFVTSPEAQKTAQIVVREQTCSALALFTDGLQRLALKLPEGIPHAPFFSPLFRFIADVEDTSQGVAQLTSFLRSPRITERADDDLTLLLAARG